MRKRPTKLLLLAVLLTAMSAQAVFAQGGQRQEKQGTFGFGALAGASFAQIDGDNFKGYNKIGVYAGLRGIVRISDRFQMRVELLYSQKGSKFESRVGAMRGEKDRSIDLDYAEVPVLAAYKVTPSYSRTQVWFEGGISIARLLNSDVTDSDTPSQKEFPFESIVDDFGKTDVNFIAGISVRPIPALGIGLRGSWGLMRFYEADEPPPVSEDREYVEFLRNYSLALFVSYHF